MQPFLNIFGDYHFWILVVIFWLISNAVNALPVPLPTSSVFYGWFFKFANGFMGSVTRALAGKIPNGNGL